MSKQVKSIVMLMAVFMVIFLFTASVNGGTMDVVETENSNEQELSPVVRELDSMIYIETQVAEEITKVDTSVVLIDVNEEPCGPAKETVVETTVEETEQETVAEVVEEEEIEPEMVYLGKYKTTAYCSCRKCCGKWSGGPTASGVMPTANHTVAADPRVLSFGTQLFINGIVYTVEDTGSGVNGKHLDIYFDSHSAALKYGTRSVDVYLVK